MVSALRNREFRTLWTAGAVSGFGSWLLVIAVPFQVFELTGSAAATGLALAVEALPALVVGPWAGVLVDRWNPARVMWLADLVSAAAVALILLDRIGLIYVALLLESVASTVFRPAGRALLPALVGTGSTLVSANSLSAAAGSVIRLTAPPLGSLLLTGFGIQLVVAIDIASYVLSAGLIAAISRRVTTPRTGDSSRHPWRDLRDGMAAVAGSRLHQGLLIGNTVFLTANAGLTALLVPFTVHRLGEPGYTLGYLISGLGVGFAAGSALSRFVLTRFGLFPVIGISQLVTAATFLFLVNAPNLATAIAATVAVGLPGSLLLISIETAVQRETPHGLLGRVGSLFFAADALAAVAGALLAPLLVTAFGLPLALNSLGALAFLAAPATWATARRIGPGAARAESIRPENGLSQAHHPPDRPRRRSREGVDLSAVPEGDKKAAQ
jgi:MFS family permease